MGRKFSGKNQKSSVLLRKNEDRAKNHIKIAEFARLTNKLLNDLDLIESFLMRYDKEKSNIRIYSINKDDRQRHNTLWQV